MKIRIGMRFMKKLGFLFLIILLVSCKRTSLIKNDFIEIAKFNGYIVEENNYGYEKYSYIKDVFYAINREYAYNIQFIEIEDSDYAKRFFEINKNVLSSNIDSNTYVKRKNKSDYNLLHIETDSDYMLVIRDDKVIIYIEAPIEYLNEIEEFLEELGLEY